MNEGLTFDIKEDGWDSSRGFIKRDLPDPKLDAIHDLRDAVSVILRIHFAGVCGSDRGIWKREAFKEYIHNSLEAEQKTLRILGHEFYGEVVEAGSLVPEIYGITKGMMVSGDSHVTCGRCLQCKLGQEEVCQDQSILGISRDGIFAKYVKIPAKNLWPITDERIRPEVGAMFDPLGNAVHTLSKVDVRGKTLAVFGCGQIGLFSIALARSYGAATIVAYDVNQVNLDRAAELGADHTYLITPQEKEYDYDIDQDAIDEVMRVTGERGVDISMEMAGFNSTVNNCIAATRPGGEVILFGIKDGDAVIPRFSDVVVKGLTIHSVIGRQLFQTWHTMQSVLGDESVGLADKIWNVIMSGGQGCVIPFSEYSPDRMEAAFAEHPKLLINMRV